MIIVFHDDRDNARAVARAVEGRGGIAWVRQCDVASSEEVGELFRFIADQISAPLRIVVNNAGVVLDSLITTMTDQAWQRVLDVNLGGVFNVTRAAIRMMAPYGYGKIINVSSTSAMIGIPGQVNYAASKAGVLALTRVAAVEAARHGIRVNAVCPGVHETDMVAGMRPKYRDALVDRIPLGRMGTPEDVAALIAFLASGESDYITGQAVAVNGGLAM